MFPPFEDLPFWLQALLTVSSVLILLLGGRTIWRIIRTVVKGNGDSG